MAPRKLPKLKMKPVEEYRDDYVRNLFDGNFGTLNLSGIRVAITIDMIRKDAKTLGSGGFGNVCETDYEGIVFARKEIKIPSQVERSDMRRYLRELEVTRDCKMCPFVVKYFGYFIYRESAEYNFYIFMEKLPFSAAYLIDRVRQLRTSRDPSFRIPEFVLGRIACSVVHALRFLRDSLQIIHRDVKPPNILMDYDGRVKLCDLGICAKLENSSAFSKAGSYPYMAPERFSPDKYDERSDVWSLGISLVELAELKNPYMMNGDQIIHLMEAIQRHPSPILNKETYSSNLVFFSSRLLEKNVETRPKYAEIERLEFFELHDLPFIYIGTGGSQKNTQRPLSVGRWIDEHLLSN